MKMERQEYQDSTLRNALEMGCDAVQFKHRGSWAYITVAESLAKVYLLGDREPSMTFPVPEGLFCCLIGDAFLPPKFESPSFVIWDCWASIDAPITNWGYSDRLAIAKLEVARLGPPFTIIKTFPITHAMRLWDANVENTCGLVFRRSTDTASKPLYVARKYPEVPRALE